MEGNQLRNVNLHKWLNPHNSAEVLSSPWLIIKLLQISIWLSFMDMPSFCSRFWREKASFLTKLGRILWISQFSEKRNDHQSPMLRQTPASLPIFLMLRRVRDMHADHSCRKIFCGSLQTMGWGGNNHVPTTVLVFLILYIIKYNNSWQEVRFIVPFYRKGNWGREVQPHTSSQCLNQIVVWGCQGWAWGELFLGDSRVALWFSKTPCWSY